MLSISSGHSAGYLTGSVGAGREDYYTGAVAEGEPPGTWHGKGAASLGLVGEVDPDVMHALYGEFSDPRDPLFADPETRDQAARLGRAPKQFRTPDEVVAKRVEAYPGTPAPEQVQAWKIEAERSQPKAVMFYDLTFSVPKSVTVLWAAYSRAATEADAAGDTSTAHRMQEKAATIETAVSDANAVMLDHVEDQVVSRVGRHGGKNATGRWVDTRNITVASFPQHTSRERDPQLHTHNAVLNRVECPDGTWRAIDGKALFAAKASAAAIAGMELREQLTRDLGVSWVKREDGNDFEVSGIEQDEMDLLSTRTRTLTTKADQLVAEYEAHHGRAATSWELNRLRQQATLATRPAKSHAGETNAEMLDRADATMRGEVAGGLARIAARFDTATATRSADRQEWSPQAVIAEAVEACHGDNGRSTFNRSELSRRIGLALPPHLGLSESGESRALIERLTDQALASDLLVQTAGYEIGDVPDDHRLANGRAATIGPDAVRYAARGHIAAEHAILRAAGERGRTAAPKDAINAWLEASESGLSAAQREAVASIAGSDAALAVLVGPAGTGKSYTVGRLCEAWNDITGGRVVGVATAQVAADVLRDDGLTDTANITAFLTAQQRLAEQRPMPGDTQLRLGQDDILVVDEASMVDTHTLTRLQATVDNAGARMVLLGDPHQLSAVGAGGMMRTVLDQSAEVHTLGEVRRFSNEWERDASLQLRDGHDSIVTEYDRRGRLIDGGTERATVTAVARAAAADRLAGREVAVVAGSNRLASEVSAAVRRHLVDAGIVAETGVILGRDLCTAGIGDVVQARRIDRTLGLTNRENYRVENVREDGGLDVVSTRTGELRIMPAEYVQADAALAYAGTVHATQGATVDSGHVILTPGMSTAAAYVGLTRGRDCNTAWAVTDSGIPNTPTATARGLLASIASGEDDTSDLSAHDIAEADQNWRNSSETLMGLTEDHSRIACRQRLDADLDQLVANGALSEENRARFGSDQGSEHLARQLRALEQAGRDPAETLRHAVTARPLDGAVSLAQVVADRIDRVEGLPVPDVDHALIPVRLAASDETYLGQLDKLLDARRQELGIECAEQQPDWALTTLGPVPDELPEREQWIERAGQIAGYREGTGWDNEDVPLGRCPGVHTPEKRAQWHRAYTAAGLPEDRRPEAELPDGRLLVRASAADRIEQAAPSFVDPAMREQHLAADNAARAAILTRSQGDERAAAGLETKAAEHTEAAARLTAVGEERASYLALHAETIGAGQAAREELKRRGIEPGTEPDRTSAEEWLAADATARREDDQHRTITEDDILDTERTSTPSAAETSADQAESSTDAKAPDPAADERDDGSDQAETNPVERLPVLSAEASAAEIRAAAEHAASVADDVADTKSQNAHEPAANDEWHRQRVTGADQEAAGAQAPETAPDHAWRRQSSASSAAASGAGE